MSVYNDILIKINEIRTKYVKNINEEVEETLKCFDKFEEDYFKERNRGREKTHKDKNVLTTLQSINEDEDVTQTQIEPKTHNDKAITEPLENGTSERSSNESNGSRRGSKKRNKNEVDGMDSPKQGKRQKRNASTKALANISKQVNLNLNQKLRREDESNKSDKPPQPLSLKEKDGDKENLVPIIPDIKIKQEKISLPPEPLELESLPNDVVVKKEVVEDAIAMPPPAIPVPKPRKLVAKKKSQDDTADDETSSGRRSTRTRKQTDNSVPAIEPRAVRASNRSARNTQTRQQEEQSEEEARPKRTRGRKKNSKSKVDVDETQSSQESAPASPAEKPRPKRTRRAVKATTKEENIPKPEEKAPENIPPEEDRVSQPEISSPILQKEVNTQEKVKKKTDKRTDKQDAVDLLSPNNDKEAVPENIELEETRVLPAHMNETVTITNSEMDKTVVLTNGVYNHTPVTPIDKNNAAINMNETVVIEKASNDNNAQDKQQNQIMDATVVIEKVRDVNAPKISEDNSILTNDSDPECEPHTPPKTQGKAPAEPTSAVKEKVQQFEELASRVTRTKTRAMAKKEQETCDNHTPPDKVFKQALSADTLNKMNAMIFNGKPPQTSSSVTKPRPVVPLVKTVSSASKVSAIRAREAEDWAKREVEDARKKKEAILEAKREMHRKKREEKMAAAAATRIAAERDRRLAVEAMERERREKQAQADQGRVDRLKEAERKKLELARKVAETEERRRAEEQARQARLAEEQRRVEALRRKQIEEAEATKKEAALMAREIEKRKKEYIEKQKLKNRHEDKFLTPLKNVGAVPPQAMEPVYMEDGFQYLNSDEDAEPVSRPAPQWCTSMARHLQLAIQTQVSSVHIDRLFSVRVHSPDLREIFPNIDRSRLKRTSSAVWRTPPTTNRLPAVTE